MKRKTKPYKPSQPPEHGPHASSMTRQHARTATAIQGDPLFRESCAAAGVEPTKRQAAKWRAKRGRAWDAHDTTQRASGAGKVA